MTEAEKRELISKYLRDNIELLKREDRVIELISLPKVTELTGTHAVDDQFDLRSYLEKVMLDSGIDLLGYVKEIPMALFARNNYIEEITIPGNVETVGRSAFYQCTNLEKVYIKDGVNHIGPGAFKYCSKLGYVTLPKTLRSVEPFAFLDIASGCKFIYEGKVEDWHKVSSDRFSTFPTGTEIVCTDGIVKVK